MSDMLRLTADLTPKQRTALLARLRTKAGIREPQRPQGRALLPVERSGELPLSFAQQRLWFLHNLDPNSAAYHIPTALRLVGELNFRALEQTLGEVVRRHEVLRTSFPLREGFPVQLISEAKLLTLPFVDLSELPETERDAESARVVAEEVQRPFDLHQGPILRCALLKLGEDDHIALFIMHHIAGDGWSESVLIREVAALYDAFSQSRPSPLPELRIQYVDYAHWQRQWLQGEVLDAQLSYWKKQLHGAPAMLEMPTDKTRPPVQSFSGAQESFALSPALSEGLNSLSRREDVTLFMVMLAAFQVLLSRYTNQDDILVGTPMTGRNRVELEGLIGLFVNTLVLRTDLSGNPTFCDLLGRVREVNLGAYAHSELPFEKLVDELQLERSLSHTPVFQAMFVMRNALREGLELPNLTLMPVAAGSNTAKFDLTLTVVETTSGLSLSFGYKTDLFEAATIERMAGHFLNLLQAIIDNPQQPIWSLPMLGQDERRQLMRRSQSAPGSNHRHECIQHMFEAQAQSHPDSVAVVFEGQQLTYGELNRRANHLANHLRTLGVAPESLVGICLEPSLEMVVSILGVLKAGGAYLPLDPAYPSERLAFMLADTRASLVVTREGLAGTLSVHEAKLVCLDSEWETIEEASGENPNSGAGTENLAYVIYTSGSTGRPKGVEVVHRNVLKLLAATEKWFEFGERDVWTLFHSYAFDFSVWELWGALGYGGRLVIVPYWVTRTPEAMYELIRSEGVTVLNQTPSAFSQLMAAEEVGTQTDLRVVIFGGEALKPESLSGWIERHGDEKPHLVNMYGITETTVHVTYKRVRAADTVADAGSVVGEAIEDWQLYLLDREQNLVPQGVSGEIYVGGEGIARGYLNRPDLTAERFIPDAYSGRKGERLYKTGDLGRYKASGEIEHLGRLDQQVKIRGFRIELGEIETALNSHPSIRESVVVAREDTFGNRQLVAHLVCHQEQSPTPIELRDYLKNQLPDYMIPSLFLILESMPLTPNGKIDLKALPVGELLSLQMEASYVPPLTSTEEILAGVWAEALGVEKVGVDDNYFALGGDSIRSIQVRSRAAERGVRFSVKQLFQRQTIRELAREAEYGESEEVVAERREPFNLISEQDRLLMKDGVEDAYPLAQLQAGMIFHSEYEPESAVYHDIISYHLKARLDQEALRLAADRLTRRHSILRTSFDLSSFSEPLQLVHQATEIPLHISDVSHLSDDEQESSLAEWFTEEKARGFEWEDAPLLRLQVHRRSDESFQFTISFHHVLLDGWSLASMLAELFRLYFSIMEQQAEIEEPALGSTFRDFVEIEQRVMKSEESKRFWTEKLGGRGLTKITRRSTPPDESKDNSQVLIVQVPISESLSEELKKLAQAKSVPVKSVLLAAHLRVMSLLSSQSDVVTGVVSNGRAEERDGERVLGLFLNTVPFRMKLDGGTWESLVEKTFETELEILPHRQYPMPRIKEELGGEPLFETAFNYTHFHVYESLQGISNAELRGITAYERTDFTLLARFNLIVQSSQVQLSIVFDLREVGEQQAEDIGRYYLRTLEAMASEPKGRYETALLLSTDEQLLLEKWNNTERERARSLCAHQMFEQQAEQTPDKIAAIFEDRQLTYSELNEQSNQLAHYLQELGVGPESRVAISLERSFDMLVAVLGVLKAGAAYVPIDPAYPLERKAFMLEDSRSVILLTQEDAAAHPDEGQARVVRLDSERNSITQQSGINLAVGVEPDNLAYVIYTSGSTGRPKGIGLTHLALTNLIEWHGETLSNGAHTMQFASLSFDASFHEMFAAWATGGTLFLIPEMVRMDPSALAGMIDQHGIEKIILPVVMLQEIAQEHAESKDSLTSLKEIITTGEQLQLTSAIRRLFGRLHECTLHNHYGPSETHVVTAYSFSRAASEWPSLPPIGKPISNTRIYVLDEHQRLAPVEVYGEIYIGGDSLARGYFGRAELTAEGFIPDPYSLSGGDRMYRTGDVGRYLSDGNIEYVGRRDNQVKIRGFRVELGEVEAALARQPSVREVAVVMREDTAGDKRLVAYVVVDSETGERAVEGRSGSPTVGEMRATLSQHLPAYMIPSAFVMMDALPLTPNGKIDRRALPAPDGTRDALKREYVAPRNGIEEGVVKIWEQVLGVERVGVEDNFFELGGHSLKATQVVSRLQKLHGDKVRLRDLFATPTVRGLAEKIGDGSETERQQTEQGLPTTFQTPQITRIEDRDYYDVSSAQRRVWIVCQQEEASRAYNLPKSFILEGAVDEEALRRALRSLVERHESLRTRFIVVAGEPKQKVESGEGIELQVVDLSREGTGEELRQEKAREIARREAREVFDLERGPLMRTKLVKITDERQVFLLTLHHIIADGWSMSVLMRELMQLYHAYREGLENPLPELEIQYRDYADWERRELSGGRMEEQQRYWQEKLRGEIEPVRIAGDAGRAEGGQYLGQVLNYEIGDEETESLRRIGRKHGASLYMSLLAAVYALLYRYSGQEDLVVACPVTGRKQQELENQVGMYLNTLLLRTETRGTARLGELLEQVKETALGAFENQEYPYEQLARELKVKREPGKAPLMEVVVTLEEQEGGITMEDGMAGDVSIRGWGESSGVSKNDLWFGFKERGKGLTATINYNSDKYSDASIGEIAASLKKILRQLAVDANVRVMDIELGDENAPLAGHDMEMDIELSL